MPIDSKECFAALTEDGQLWEIYQAAQTGGGGGITSINGDTTAAQLISGTAPITASTAAGTTTISTSIDTNRIVGRSTAGTGVMEELTPVGITVSGGNITGIGGTVGTVDNAVPRADGTGGYTVQGSDIVIDDAVPFLSGVTGLDSTDYITVVGNTFVANQQIFFGSLTGGSALTVNTPYFVRDVGGAGANTFRISTTSGGGVQTLGSDITAGTVGAGQANVAIKNQHTGQTNSALVLTPKGTGALIAGPKPDGTATGGNARGAGAVDLQLSRTGATQVASGASSSLIASANCIANNTQSICISSSSSTASGARSTCISTESCTASGSRSLVLGGGFNTASGTDSVVIAAESATATANKSIAISQSSRSDRFAMMSHSSGAFAANGDAQRARFVMRCKTTTNAAVEMTLDGAAPGASNRLTIPAGKYLTGTINIAGIKSDGATAASYIRQFSIKHISATATTSLVGTVNTVGVDEAAGTTISITANDPNDALKVDVTGITSETWRWVAAVDVVEVGYGT